MAYNPYGYQGTPNIPSGTNDIQGAPWVSSIDEVRAASVFYGRQIFMDQNEQIFYIKSHSGEIKAFKFEEIPTSTTVDMSNYVTKEQFEDLRMKYEQLIQQQSTTAAVNEQPQSNGNYATNETVPGYTGTSQGTVLSNVQANEYGTGTDQPVAQ